MLLVNWKGGRREGAGLSNDEFLFSQSFMYNLCKMHNASKKINAQVTKFRGRRLLLIRFLFQQNVRICYIFF